MAKVFALDEDHCDAELRSALQNGLRVYDECVALPQAHKSTETGAFKNVVLNLNGTETELNPDIFSPNWFCGVSGIEISANAAESILKDPLKRASALHALVSAIPTEMQNEDYSIGPELDATEDDRDVQDWVAGFDSPGCCVGIYSASQARSVDLSNNGISRPHRVYFLMCKAGGGLAAQSFHSRLSASLKKGLSLDQALTEGSSPGAQALRRVGMAAQRNRGRILCIAAEALGIHEIDRLSDMGCCESKAHRVAVTHLNVVSNSLQKMSTGFGVSTYQYYSGCVDSQLSQGIISCSNAGEGFLLFADQDGTQKVSIKNSACNAIPFSSVRIKSNKSAVLEAAETLKRERERKPNISSAHVDSKWISERFSWKGRDFGIDLEPPPLQGTYNSETFSSVWCRELGLSKCRAVRLEPEIVCIPATEPAKLRAAARHVIGSAAASKK
jgi:hypothetical protein